MFKELFKIHEEKLEKLFVGSHETAKGLSIIDLETGEVEDFKNMNDLIKKIQDKPRDYMAFFRKTSKQLRAEAKDEGGEFPETLEPVMIRVPEKLANQIKK